ncbi:MAG: hypothetical protein IT178_03020 [Acidobacteria bacterium]|nr:hypothetical protein [Acidobacteriota bacterium]
MLLPVMVLAALVAQAPPQLLDRTLAIVGGRTITQSDARTVLTLGLVDGTDVNRALVERLVDRELMLREAERYAPPDPAEAEVAARLAAAEARAGGADALAATLAAGGFTSERLRAWVRDDLRLAAYLAQRFVADDRRNDLIADWVSDLRRRTPVTLIIR